jgi:histidine triad (HIT) family protein
MSSIFSKIISGEIPAYKIAEDDRFLAFLDAFPLVEGHTLVIPKQEVDYLFDIEDDLLSDLMCFAKQVAKRMDLVLPCTRIGVSVIGLEVPHAHIHLIPMNSVSDMDFSKAKLKIEASRMKQIEALIKGA